jgi:hypothetical protein
MAIRLDRLATDRRRLAGLSVVRVGIGVAALYHYLINLPFRESLWGPAGDWPFSNMLNMVHHFWIFSVYAFGHSDLWFQLMFFTGIAVAALWTVFGGRPLTILHAVFFWSLALRNPTAVDGGDNLAEIVLLFMCFQTTNAYLSPSAARVRARLESVRGVPRMSNLLHNVATYLVIFQTCTVYLVAGLWKVSGSVWQHGTAMYYISHEHGYSVMPLFPTIMSFPTVSVFVSYLTIAIQLLIIPAVLTRHRTLRLAVLALVAGMHLGIICCMGLFSFGLSMLAADAALVDDGDHAVVLLRFRRVQAFVQRFRGAARTVSSALEESA